MMKFAAGLLAVIIMALSGCSPAHNSRIENKNFLGKWTAYSRNHMLISGDMTVSHDRLDFSRKGTVAFEIVQYDGKEYILKINKDVDAGVFMRIGPIGPSDSSERLDMEVAYYVSKETALAKRKDRMDNATSWGVYTRMKSRIEQAK